VTDTSDAIRRKFWARYQQMHKANPPATRTDQPLRIDDPDVWAALKLYAPVDRELTEFDARFVRSIPYWLKAGIPLSPRQRAIAERILDDARARGWI
jgi:hypothetical protein